MGEPRATAVIAAAGSGERLGAGGPKALAKLAGKPMVAWSLEAAATASSIESIVVAAPPGAEGELERLLGAFAPGVPGSVVAGGGTRAESVSAALEATRTELVLVHDAARPLAHSSLFDAVTARLVTSSGAAAVIAAAPIVDTVKRARTPRGAAADHEAPEVAETLDRDLLWAAQTPQGFRADELRKAQAAAGEDSLVAATDEARLIEERGGTVLLEPSPASNIKVTTPADLAAAEALLAAFGRVQGLSG